MLPKWLEEMEPSPALAAFLSTLTDESLSGYDRIRVLQAYQRLASFFQAQVFEEMASISQLMTELEADPEIAHDVGGGRDRGGVAFDPPGGRFRPGAGVWI